jgi:hypothetical protein
MIARSRPGRDDFSRFVQNGSCFMSLIHMFLNIFARFVYHNESFQSDCVEFFAKVCLYFLSILNSLHTHYFFRSADMNNYIPFIQKHQEPTKAFIDEISSLVAILQYLPVSIAKDNS